MDEKIIIYAKYDEYGSIIAIRSNIFLNTLDDWEKVDEWEKGQDGYLYAHADNGEYVVQKYGKPLFDENGIPNFHDSFVEWTEEEKEILYPPVQPQPSEQDLINADLYVQIAQLSMNGISMMSIGTSPRYDLIKKYYDLGIYNEQHLDLFVSCSWINEEEKEQIK